MAKKRNYTGVRRRRQVPTKAPVTWVHYGGEIRSLLELSQSELAKKNLQLTEDQIAEGKIPSKTNLSASTRQIELSEAYIIGGRQRGAQKQLEGEATRQRVAAAEASSSLRKPKGRRITAKMIHKEIEAQARAWLERIRDAKQAPPRIGIAHIQRVRKRKQVS